MMTPFPPKTPMQMRRAEARKNPARSSQASRTRPGARSWRGTDRVRAVTLRTFAKGHKVEEPPFSGSEGDTANVDEDRRIARAVRASR
jgi:hypothetical protein